MGGPLLLTPDLLQLHTLTLKEKATCLAHFRGDPGGDGRSDRVGMHEDVTSRSRGEKVYNDSSMRRNPEWHRNSWEQKLWWIFKLC